MPESGLRLKPQQLYQECRLDELEFTSSDDLQDLNESARFVGQPRAEQALDFGVGINREGYNIFALGEQGTGKHTFIRDLLERRSKKEKIPQDICYVTNFEKQHSPRLLMLKAGKGKELAEDMKRLMEDVRNAMQGALENEEYQNRAQSIVEEMQEKQKKAFEDLRQKARERGLEPIPTPGGLAFTATKNEGLKVLTEPFVWDGLKRALRSGKLKIESIGQIYSLISTVSLEPEALQINVKVVLIGVPILYYLLRYHDPDFGHLFKVEADFALQMNRNKENLDEFVRLIACAVHKQKLLPFEQRAVARVIEHGSRLLGDTQKISIRMEEVSNLLNEADCWARKNGDATVKANHVQKAIDSWIYRSDRLRERMQEQIERDIVMIDTEGTHVGQVNGLSVISLGEFAFGRPSRITARIRLGKGEVVDIEREVAMGGPIHSKGVMILSGFLGGRYSLENPLSLSASLVFEQSYGGVEGDSASSAELYALLSAIADAPIRQDLAVTGSVSQYGMVQPIGGVNEKIEGFFDVCASRGLNGKQGVLIPASNIQHLMLRQNVIDAVDAGKFHIYAVKTIDQGIEILSGMTAGEPDETGAYPEESLNGKVQRRLKEFAERRQRFAREASHEKGGDFSRPE
jgi:hypothetical protein